MAEITCKAPWESLELCAVVTRADGTVEDLGQIAYNHRRWYMRLRNSLTQRFGK